MGVSELAFELYPLTAKISVAMVTCYVEKTKLTCSQVTKFTRLLKSSSIYPSVYKGWKPVPTNSILRIIHYPVDHENELQYILLSG